MSGLRLIVAVLVAGQVLFGGVLLVLAQLGHLPLTDPASTDLGLLAWVALLIAGVSLVAAFVVRGALWRGLASEPDRDRRLQRYGQAVLVFVALLEGASLLNLVTILLLPGPWLNVAAVLVLVAVVLASFPSDEQFSNLTL